MKKLFLIAVLLGILIGHIHTYPMGIYLDLPVDNWCGVEFNPTPGLFCDVS